LYISYFFNFTFNNYFKN